MKLSTVGACALAFALSAGLAGCGGSNGGSNPSGSNSGTRDDFVDGATFTMALAGDPGKLDPQSAAGSALFTVNQLAYDTLVAVNGDDGTVESQLASDWKVDGTTVTLTLNDGITCS